MYFLRKVYKVFLVVEPDLYQIRNWELCDFKQLKLSSILLIKIEDNYLFSLEKGVFNRLRFQSYDFA